MREVLYLSSLDPLSLSDLRIAASFLTPEDRLSFMGYDSGFEKASLEDRKGIAEILLSDLRTLAELDLRPSQIFSSLLFFRQLSDLEPLSFDTLLLPYVDLPFLLRLKGAESLVSTKEVYLVANYDKMPDYLFDPLCLAPYVKGIIPNHIPCGRIRNGARLEITPEMGDYLIEKDLYFIPYLKGLMKPTRFLHAVSVAKTAYEIAIRNNLNPERAYQAGLFHDCGKDVPLTAQMKLLKDHFTEFLPLPEFAYHQFVGSYLAKGCFGIEDEEVLSAIRFHCTGKTDMSRMEKCIYAADKVEPTRQFPTEKGREAVYQDLDSGFLVVLQEQEKYFAKIGINEREADLTDQMYRSLGL